MIYLDERTMSAIFDCVYTMEYGLQESTKLLLKEQMFNDLVKALRELQSFNYRYRNGQVAELFPLFESTVGPMETNSDGTTLWLAMGLAIKDVYGLRRSTLKELLELVNVKK